MRALYVVVLLSVMAGSLAGCSREYYRTQADAEAYALVEEKSTDPRWTYPDFTIEIDPRSRYYEPGDPDYPPMPPDDPASHEFMHCVDCMRGWPCWYIYGETAELDNPGWQERLGEYVELTEDGAVKLGLEDAVQVALIQSRNYQQQLETTYLSALDVSTERFRFEVQFFGGNDTNFTHLGSERGPGGETNTLRTDTDLEMRRRLATAGELVVGFANSFVWQFAGPDTNFTNSLIDFSLVQPLLRGAGQDVALEQLTIAERTLLANLRAFQRYRKGFYTNIAIGSFGVTGPQRRGGFFGGTGLTGFTGTGAGGFGGVGGITGFGRGGFGGGGVGGGGAAGAGFAGGGAGAVGGFIGLLQQLQQLRNQQDSLDAELRTLGLLEALLEAGFIQTTQVDQFRQAILTDQANLLAAENGLEDTLQSFKTSTLTLPPDLPIELDDSTIRQFQFIDRRLTEVQNRLSDFIEQFGELPDAPPLQRLQQALDDVAVLREEVRNLFEIVRTDLEHLETQSEVRERYMTPEQRQEFAGVKLTLAQSHRELQGRFRTGGVQLRQLRAGLRPQTRAQTADGIVELMTALSALVQELSLVQARARLEAVVMEPVELDPQVAIDIARANRLDWMNNRAALVDSWRLIQFNADALQSNLDVTFSGDIGTLGNNPVKFRDETGRLRVGLEFDAPFERLLERNNFRQALIDYEQDRRQIIQFGDGVMQTLDSALRQLEQLQVNLEIQRQAMTLSIRRVDELLERLREPPPPPQPGQPPVQLSDTLSRDLLSALDDLRNTQNNFMSVWLVHYGARMTLMRDLGLMQIDENGLWIDIPVEEAIRATEEQYPLPPAVPYGLIQEVDPRAESPESLSDRIRALLWAKSSRPDESGHYERPDGLLAPAPETASPELVDSPPPAALLGYEPADDPLPQPSEPSGETGQLNSRGERQRDRASRPHEGFLPALGIDQGYPRKRAAR